MGCVTKVIKIQPSELTPKRKKSERLKKISKHCSITGNKKGGTDGQI